MRLRKIRIAVAGLCLAVAVTCTGCKSSEVKNAERLINDIGEVTLSSGDAINAASSAYADLGDQQTKVENADTLTEAENAYNQLIKEQAAPIEDAINAIPQPVTAECEDAVANAEKLYARSVDEVKAAVSNVDVLTAAQKSLEDITVQNAIDAIDQIGEVTINSQELIDAATAAYQNVPANRRSDITNYSALTDATGKINQLKKDAVEAAGKAAVAKLKKSTDEVEGITWYEPSCMPTYTNTRCYVLPYIGERNGNYWLRCKVDYAADDWVFFDHIIVNIDGEKRDTISFGYGDVTRDVSFGAKLCEVADFAPTSSQTELLRDISTSQKTIIRFEGDDYHYDMVVSDKDKQGIKEVLDAYEYVK